MTELLPGARRGRVGHKGTPPKNSSNNLQTVKPVTVQGSPEEYTTLTLKISKSKKKEIEIYAASKEKYLYELLIDEAYEFYKAAHPVANEKQEIPH
jgi:hypothetical protein